MDSIERIKKDFKEHRITEQEAIESIHKIGDLSFEESTYLVSGWKEYFRPMPENQYKINKLIAARYELIEKLDSLDKKKKAYDALEQLILETSIL